jgi:hypothetical protein
MAGMQRRKEASLVMDEIMKLLIAYPVRIENAVCLALGDPYNVKSMNGLSSKTCGQYLLACAIADALGKHYASPSAISIVVFDPVYDMTCHGCLRTYCIQHTSSHPHVSISASR